jgi:hypothetical protein
MKNYGRKNRRKQKLTNKRTEKKLPTFKTAALQIATSPTFLKI